MRGWAFTLLVACGGGAVTPPDDASIDASTPEAQAEAEASAPDASAIIDARVADILAKMTLAEKVGQMTLPSYSFLASDQDVVTYALGGLLAGGGDAPGTATPSEWLALTTKYRALAKTTRLGIPLVFGIDAVHGNGKMYGATMLPHDIGLGCANDPDLVRRAFAITASESLAAGFSWIYSPELDVGLDERWGRTYESFGEDTALVSSMATGAVNGYASSIGMLSCAKHALGAGGTTWGTGVKGGIDQGDTQVSEQTMRAVHLPPFKSAIDAGVMSIMISYSSWNGSKMSSSSKWLTDVIKGELGFRGFLVSDWGALNQLPGTIAQRVAAGIDAGLDMIMVPDDYVGFEKTLTDAINASAIPMTRIDDAVTRILRAKITSGVYDATEPSSSGLASIGSAANRAVAREAVSKSLVLLKNDGVLPLKKNVHVHLAGKGGDDLGIQSGGWTLGWQGSSGLDLGGGQTIRAALSAVLGKNGGTLTYSANGTNATGASVGVVVVHELPYAEYLGDTTNPSLSNTADANVYDGTSQTAIANMTAANIPLVLVLVTGRPIRIESLLPSFGAVVAAWLPGSEGGGGVADALFGDVPIHGRLSKSWPKDATVLPIDHSQSSYDPLFAFGFGLDL
jgi:beta-glucosidase